MASVPLSVEQLLDAVAQLPLAKQREFRRRLADQQAKNGQNEQDDAKLMRAAKACLPATTERRLRRLVAKSERGELTPQELTAYRVLAERARQLDASRAKARAELAR